MDQIQEATEEREILLRTVDLLSMDILRLKSENESLQHTIQALRKGSSPQNPAPRVREPETVWTKAMNYYRREGLINTLKKIFSKLSSK